MPLFQEPETYYKELERKKGFGEFRATIIETEEAEILLEVLNKKFILTGNLSPIFPFLPAEAMEKNYGDRLGILLDTNLGLFPRAFVNHLPSAENLSYPDDSRVTRYYNTTSIPIPVYIVENYRIQNGWIYASCAYGDECCFPASALSKEPKEFWKMLKPSHTAGKGPKNSLGDGYFEVENNTVTLYNSSGKATQTLVGSACVVQNAQENILQIADGTKLKSYDMTPDGGGFEGSGKTIQNEIDISALGHVYDIWIDNKKNFYIFASQIGERKMITIAPMRPKGKSKEAQKILPIAQFEADTILEINDINDIVCIKAGIE